MSDLYEVLGVARDASPADVRKAFRAKAKTAHPDAGGDRAAFEAISRAAEVLSDPERRARYDRSGEIDDRPDNSEAEAIQIIGNLVRSALMSSADLSRDFAADMRAQLQIEISGLELTVHDIKRKVVRAEAMGRKFSGSGAGLAVVSKVLAEHRRSMDAEIAARESRAAVLRRALAILQEVRFAADPPAPVHPTGFLFRFASV